MLEAERLLFKPLDFQLRGPRSAQARMPAGRLGAFRGRKAGSRHPTRPLRLWSRELSSEGPAFGHLERLASWKAWPRVDTALVQTPAGDGM